MHWSIQTLQLPEHLRELEDCLNDGWEPFAVIPLKGGEREIYLKKIVEKPTRLKTFRSASRKRWTRT